MKDVEFRGKREDTLEWVYGYYTNFPGAGPLIETAQNDYRVIPETVGQYLGFPDDNKTRIYEGDAVEVNYSDIAGETHFVIMIMKHPFDYSLDEVTFLNYCNKLKVIGNIYDNPDIKGEKKCY